MPEVVCSRLVDQTELDELLEPRDDVVLERRLDDGSFEAAEGPVSAWRRTVEVERDTHDGGPDAVLVTERFQFVLAIPIWRFVYTRALARALRKGYRGRPLPWWSPPDRLDRRVAGVLGLLSLLAIVAGYLGTLLTQTNTYFKADFGASDSAVGAMMSIVRFGALIALAIVALADRRGRRRILLAASVLGCVITATGALAPGLVALGLSQTLARALSTSMALIISIVAVEETPKGSRGYALSVLTMAGGFGAGIAVMMLWVADLEVWAWRVMYLVPLVAVPLVVRFATRLPETRRFEVAGRRSELAGAGPAPSRPRLHLGRLSLLSAAGLFLALFAVPASSFQNEYLRSVHGYGATALIAFNILTNTPGGVGIIVGGKLADARGRRLIGGIGVGFGAAFTVLLYLGSGWTIWLWSVLAALVGGLAIPALAVYGPELFPTEARGRANGVINLFSVLGSALGLAVVGVVADHIDGGLSRAVPLMAVGPLIVVALILFAYPETAARELEELNPEDAPISRELFGLEGLDPDILPGGWQPRISGPRQARARGDGDDR